VLAGLELHLLYREHPPITLVVVVAHRINQVLLAVLVVLVAAVLALLLGT
jgi:hypothetical protein